MMGEMPERIWIDELPRGYVVHTDEWQEHDFGATEYVRADTVPRWVSVEDRLPGGDCHCLAWDTGYERAVSCRYYAATRTFGLIHPRVTHWREAPGAPEANDAA